jgi:hypothetical protein
MAAVVLCTMRADWVPVRLPWCVVGAAVRHGSRRAQTCCARCVQTGCLSDCLSALGVGVLKSVSAGPNGPGPEVQGGLGAARLGAGDPTVVDHYSVQSRCGAESGRHCGAESLQTLTARSARSNVGFLWLRLARTSLEVGIRVRLAVICGTGRQWQPQPLQRYRAG